MQETDNIQPGTILYNRSNYHGLSRVKVERVTPTQIILQTPGTTKLRKPFVEGCSAIGENGYSATSYYTATAELDEEYIRQRLMKQISDFCQGSKLKTLSTEQLTEIWKICK